MKSQWFYQNTRGGLLSMNKQVLGRNIYNARRDQNMTGEQFSELCDINPSYLRAIEAGTKVPSLPMFVRICEKLRVSPSFLLCGVADEKSGDEGMDEILSLYQTATPSQLKVIRALIKSALDVCKQEE